ncbi:hypothetical protein BDR06DRAFT_953210 [Suillus hirtellus]|nr:hypothetical protein BDR06DRAFT_953210 [Suillus hirtellus]
MHFSFLAVVVALTASMFVSACGYDGDPCDYAIDCCGSLVRDTKYAMRMSRSLCNQDSTTWLTRAP